MADTHKFRYDTMMELGFKREDLSDHGHVKEYGYDSFVVDYKLRGGCNLHWDHRSRQVELWRFAADGGSIIGRITGLNFEQVKMYIKFFKEPRKQD